MLKAPLTFELMGLHLPNIFAINLVPTAAAEYFVFVHYLSKFMDFFDTFFIVLRKKDDQLSFLHVYHHATIGGIWGLLLHLGYGWGTTTFGAAINSLTHVLMYTHYLVSSYGIRHPFKAALTSWQISQFYFCVAHAVVVPLGAERLYNIRLAYLQLGYHLTMIALFSNFYRKRYTNHSDETSQPSMGSERIRNQGAKAQLASKDTRSEPAQNVVQPTPDFVRITRRRAALASGNQDKS